MVIEPHVPCGSKPSCGALDGQGSGLDSQGFILGIRVLGSIVLQSVHPSRLYIVGHVMSMSSWDTVPEIVVGSPSQAEGSGP